MKSLLCLAFLVTLSLAIPRSLIAEDNHYFNPSVWRILDEASPDSEVTFYLFLRQQNLDLLDRLFNDVTTPGNPEWRHWWSLDRVKNLIAPPSGEKAVVRSWLKHNGVSNVQDLYDAFKVKCSVESASKLFETTFYHFEHIPTNTRVIRQVGPSSIPSHLQEFIHFITGISEFPYAARKFAYHRQGGARDDTAGKVVPYVIDQLYAIPWEDKKNVTQQSSVGVAEFEGDRSFSQSDLEGFQKDNLLPVQQVPKDQIIGPYSPNIPDIEATLDIQYAWGVSYNTSAWYWTVDGWMLEFAVEYQNLLPNAPSVVSMSWGWTEDSQCQITSCSNSQDYVQRCNTEFKALSTTGVTLTASSGDQGAPGDGNSNCRDNQEPVTAIFPGASPYVLSIGATMLVASNERNQRQTDTSMPNQPVPPICSQYTCADISTMEEVACSYPEALITTGGGFSVYSSRPSWQDTAVTQYFNTVPNSDLPPSTDFNKDNRGFPDVSALGHNYLINVNGRYEIVDGTSCSAPVWGGLIALWNQYEIHHGRPTLGFVNPLMYSAWGSDKTTFFDIVNGNNKCTESQCCEYGYATAAGWDPVTGLGSPNFPVLYNYIQTQSSKLYRP